MCIILFAPLQMGCRKLLCTPEAGYKWGSYLSPELRCACTGLPSSHSHSGIGEVFFLAEFSCPVEFGAQGGEVVAAEEVDEFKGFGGFGDGEDFACF